ncbi:MAG TPA: FkbM family methyltransferase [Chthoniobacterales bacterium]|nr:FkbM family methyltransferase [Chthoniobacterales bacterium]
MITYAQNFEDVMLERLFRDQRTGFYVDAGAGSPIVHSVTKWFYDRGWSGINIEPQPNFFSALARERPRDITLNCGVGARSGEAVFYDHAIREWSTFDPELAHHSPRGLYSVVERTVPIRTLTDIIEEHGAGRVIDFLKIDVEGFESEVLRGLELSHHRPAVILVEAIDRDTRKPNHELWEPLLSQQDYDSVYFDGVNRFYVPRERATLAEHFRLPPGVLDEFITHEQALLQSQCALQREQIQTLAGIIDELRSGPEPSAPEGLRQCIRLAYEYHLGRSPGSEELERCVSDLKNGLHVSDFLESISRSREAQERRSTLYDDSTPGEVREHASSG